MNPPTVALALSIAALVAYGAYRVLSPVPEQPAAPSATVEPSVPGLPDALPDFALEDLEGHSTPITTWLGRPLLINFWATWCAPCLREIPLLKQYQTDHPALQVIGIAVDRVEPVVDFAAEMDFNYPVLVGLEAMSAAGEFGVDFVAMPFTIFAGPTGAVLGTHTGELHAEHLENLSAVLRDLESGSIDIEVARDRLAGRR